MCDKDWRCRTTISNHVFKGMVDLDHIQQKNRRMSIHVDL